MAVTPKITPTNQTVWINRHDTFQQRIDNLYDIANGDSGNPLGDYNATTAAIQEMIGKATAQNKRLRALGGGWSFSKVAATEGWLLNTKQLNLLFEISESSVSSQYSGESKDLLFVQCGNSIQELNNFLKKRNRSLRTCGASNGQTIVGAFSTGTHGSAIDCGATPDFIVGLHLLTGPSTHIWLERASHPVASETFLQKIQSTLVRNDELFNAALVSFGSFGFIHGVMIETEAVFLLECYRQRVPLDKSLKAVMETLDFSAAEFLPHGSERPFHFQVVVNQYDLERGAYITVMYKREFGSYQPPLVDFGKAGPGDDVPAFLGKLTDFIPVVTSVIVNNLIKTAFATYNNVWGTLGEIFTNNNTRGRVLSTAIGVPASFVNEVNDLLISLNGSHGPFSGVFSYRYVRKSEAILAFTRYDPTCIIELDGVESQATRRFYEKVWKELEERQIPHTYHWGKIHDLDPKRLEKMYDSGIQRWISARNALLPAESLKVFSNEMLDDFGLSKATSPKLPV